MQPRLKKAHRSLRLFASEVVAVAGDEIDIYFQRTEKGTIKVDSSLSKTAVALIEEYARKFSVPYLTVLQAVHSEMLKSRPERTHERRPLWVAGAAFSGP